MNISTQLTHLNDRLAVCMANLLDGETHISVYASAYAAESEHYPDLAQKRAVELVFRLHEKGRDAIQELTFSAKISSVASVSQASSAQENTRVTPVVLLHSASIVNEIAQPEAAVPKPEIKNDADMLDELDVAPW